jgi:GMP synthase (glutamine-hydrolysing)
MTRDAHRDRVLILDFGAQYTQLIARRIRERGVYCEIHPCHTPVEAHARLGAEGARALRAGRRACSTPTRPHADRALLELGVPVLGICYGLQWLCQQLGGVVEKAEDREYGRAQLKIERPGDPLFAGSTTARRAPVWMSHGDRVLRLPAGFEVLASSDHSPFAAVRDRARPLYGVQFHPEVVHTEGGGELLANFVHRICGCGASWTMEAFLEEAVRAIRAQVGDGHAVCGLSGGVDSSVAAALVHRAIGERLHCILVDTGCCARARSKRCAAPSGRARHPAARRGRPRALPRRARRRHGPGAQAAHHRAPVHRGLRGGGERSATRGSWCRERSTRT